VREEDSEIERAGERGRKVCLRACIFLHVRWHNNSSRDANALVLRLCSNTDKGRRASR
jgi:hypothetical protein